MSRRIFKNTEHQIFYEKNGYVKIPLLSEKEIDNMLKFCVENISSFEPGFSSTVASNDSNLKKKIKLFLDENLANKLPDILIDYKPFIYAFLCKTKNTESSLDLHQDWNFIDETTGLSTITIWCPLVETNDENGMLSVLPGSHLLPRFARASPASSGIEKILLKGYKHLIKELPTILGEAIIFDNALLHSSAPNLTNQNRYVVGLMTIPNESKGLLYYNNAHNGFDEYETDADFYLNNSPFITNSGKYVKSLPPIYLDNINESLISVFGEPIFCEDIPKLANISWWKKLFNIRSR